VPICPPTREHWRHMANTIELVLPSACPSPQPKWQIDRFNPAISAQLMAESPHNGRPYRRKLPLPMKRSRPPSITIPLAHPSPQPKRHLNWLSRFCADDRSVPILHNGTPLPPQNCPLPWGRSGPHLIHGSLGQPESSAEMASRSVQPFLQGLLV